MKKQSKTAKVRALLAKGRTPAEITKSMRLPRNFVYQVQYAMRKKEKETGGELPLDHPMFAKKPTKVLPGSKAKKQGASAVQVGGAHYKNMGIQPWDVVDTWPLEQRIGYYRGSALKYLLRMGTKDVAVLELGKARHYIDKLIEVETNKEK